MKSPYRLLAAEFGAILLIAICGISASRALADDKPTPEVAVSIWVDRSQVAPGETIKLVVSRTKISKLPFSFPSWELLAVHVYLKTPAGEVIEFWPYSTPRADRPIKKTSFLNRPPTGGKQVVITATVQMINPSQEQLITPSGEPAALNLRAEGEYQLWAEYRVPRVEGAPIDAWDGHVKSETLRLVVREIPVANRTREPTAEQLQMIEEVMAGGPGAMQALNRIGADLKLTEHEGLALHIARLLVEHQPRTPEGKYANWWGNLYYELFRRACAGGKSRAIEGPYLQDFEKVTVPYFEHSIIQHSGFGGFGFVTALIKDGGETHAGSKERLIKFARSHAIVPRVTEDFREDDIAERRLVAAWHILLAFGELHEGMPLKKAEEMLGKPERLEFGGADGRKVWVTWSFHRGFRGGPTYLRSRVGFNANGEEVVAKFESN